MTCIAPRALAGEIILALLKPLSCHAMAAASDAGAPDCAVNVRHLDWGASRPGEAIGAACGTDVRLCRGGGVDGAAPVGSSDHGPGDQLVFGFRPFM